MHSLETVTAKEWREDKYGMIYCCEWSEPCISLLPLLISACSWSFIPLLTYWINHFLWYCCCLLLYCCFLTLSRNWSCFQAQEEEVFYSHRRTVSVRVEEFKINCQTSNPGGTALLLFTLWIVGSHFSLLISSERVIWVQPSIHVFCGPGDRRTMSPKTLWILHMVMWMWCVWENIIHIFCSQASFQCVFNSTRAPPHHWFCLWCSRMGCQCLESVVQCLLQPYVTRWRQQATPADQLLDELQDYKRQ